MAEIFNVLIIEKKRVIEIWATENFKKFKLSQDPKKHNF